MVESSLKEECSTLTMQPTEVRSSMTWFGVRVRVRVRIRVRVL